MKSVVAAYKAYPLTDKNKYNNAINAKRVGFQQGYEKGCKDLIDAASTWMRSKIINELQYVDKRIVDSFINDFKKAMKGE